jgi:phosphatidylinositol glycan class C protein
MKPSAPLRRRPWRRVLFERQEYEDDWVDPSFLSDLRRNENARAPRYGAVVAATGVLVQQLAVLALFLGAFALVFAGRLGLSALLGVAAAAFALGALVFRGGGGGGGGVASRVALFVGALYGLSPVLKTLTLAYSSDTIWALSIALSALHVAAHDYGFLSCAAGSTRFKGVVSLNAAIFASVLLASRLPSANQAFGVMLLAFESFAGFPFLARHLKQRDERAHRALTLALVAAASALLLVVNPLVSLVFVAGVVFVALVCPYWLLYLQRFKNEIRGPWDYDDEHESLT